MLAQVQRAAADAQRFFPLSLGSEGSCQIGGNLSTNAGGHERAALRHDARAGARARGGAGRRPRARVAQRRCARTTPATTSSRLFLGAEGTLGVITAASLKLFPADRAPAPPRSSPCRTCRRPSTLLGQLREASGDRVSSFELMPRIAIELDSAAHRGRAAIRCAQPHRLVRAVRTVRRRAPASRCAASSRRRWQRRSAPARCSMRRWPAASASAPRFWKLRENHPRGAAPRGRRAQARHLRAGGRAAGFRGARRRRGSPPTSRTAGWSPTGTSATATCISTSVPRRAPMRAAFLARGEAVRRAIHDLVHEFGGSFSAEHGIGRLKVGGAGALRFAGGAGADARGEAGIRPARHHESGQGAARELRSGGWAIESSARRLLLGAASAACGQHAGPAPAPGAAAAPAAAPGRSRARRRGRASSCHPTSYTSSTACTATASRRCCWCTAGPAMQITGRGRSSRWRRTTRWWP